MLFRSLRANPRPDYSSKQRRPTRTLPEHLPGPAGHHRLDILDTEFHKDIDCGPGKAPLLQALYPKLGGVGRHAAPVPEIRTDGPRSNISKRYTNSAQGGANRSVQQDGGEL